MKFPLICLMTILFSYDAMACRPILPMRDQDREWLYEHIYYIGAVKLLSVEDRYLKATYKLLSQYHPNQKINYELIAIERDMIDSCQREFPRVGGIYEEIFIKDPASGKIDIAGDTLFNIREEEWDEFKKNSEGSAELKKYEHDCQNIGGHWAITRSQVAPGWQSLRELSCEQKELRK